MTPEALQQKTYDLWVSLHRILDDPVMYHDPTDPVFLREMSRYGDLALAQTWETAFSSLKATLLATYCLDDGSFLIEFYLIQSSQREGWSHLLPAVLRQLLTVPDALSLLADGWREIDEYGCGYGATEAEVKALLQPFEALLRLSTQSRNGVEPI
jgi:hypothetical protein